MVQELMRFLADNACDGILVGCDGILFSCEGISGSCEGIFLCCDGILLGCDGIEAVLVFLLVQRGVNESSYDGILLPCDGIKISIQQTSAIRSLKTLFLKSPNYLKEFVYF